MLWLSHINLLCWVMIPETTKYYTHDNFIEALYCRALSHVTHHLILLLAYTNYSGFGWLGKDPVNCVTAWITNTPPPANVSARPSDAIFGSDLGQIYIRQWPVAWWRQTLTSTFVDFSSVKFLGTYLRTIHSEYPRYFALWLVWK